MTSTRVRDVRSLLLGGLTALVVACGGGSDSAGSLAAGLGTSCTPGTDCYCDKVKGGVLNDPLLLFCEDFEAPTLTSDTGLGNGAPYYGPWYDDTGDIGNRGVNSYWNRVYFNGTDGFRFASGQPSAPALGRTCALDFCVGAKAWDSADRWSANNYGPQMAIYTLDSDFTAEIATLTVPSNSAGGGNGVFDGNASLAQRIPAGATHGVAGEAKFASGTRNIGLTMAIAYPVNSMTSGIWGPQDGSANAAWKHNEWVTVYNQGGFDGLFVFYNQDGPRSGIPFAGFLGAFKDQDYTNCASIAAEVGIAECIGGGLGIHWNTPENYDQPTDWPFGTWGCVRGYLENAGLLNMRMRVWFQGPNMTSERLIIDFTANGTQLDNKNGYSAMLWNAYANTNQGDGYVPTSALTFRYEDNVHVRAGLPVSCAQIGFPG